MFDHLGHSDPVATAYVKQTLKITQADGGCGSRGKMTETLCHKYLWMNIIFGQSTYQAFFLKKSSCYCYSIKQLTCRSHQWVSLHLGSHSSTHNPCKIKGHSQSRSTSYCTDGGPHVCPDSRLYQRLAGWCYCKAILFYKVTKKNYGLHISKGLACWNGG